jgi:phosphoribosyl 1,2-cyclic phosphodiesterase
VLTHLDIDHSGGLPDFPQAQVHLWARELARSHGDDVTLICSHDPVELERAWPPR